MRFRFGVLCDHAHPGDYEVRDGYQVAAFIGVGCLLKIGGTHSFFHQCTMKRAAQKTMDTFFKAAGSSSKMAKRSEGPFWAWN